MEEVCSVCGKPLDEIYAVSCIGCGGKIHFPSAENSGYSCGSIVTQWNICGITFVCKKCSATQKPFTDVKANS
jgi:hypothetical protein